MTAAILAVIGYIALAVIGYIALIAIVLRVLRANGEDTDAQDAADSVRQSLDPDHRLDELRSYTTNRVRAGTAWGRPLQ
jgi:hypothetical protein